MAAPGSSWRTGSRHSPTPTTSSSSPTGRWSSMGRGSPSPPTPPLALPGCCGSPPRRWPYEVAPNLALLADDGPLRPLARRAPRGAVGHDGFVRAAPGTHCACLLRHADWGGRPAGGRGGTHRPAHSAGVLPGSAVAYRGG